MCVANGPALFQYQNVVMELSVTLCYRQSRDDDIEDRQLEAHFLVQLEKIYEQIAM